METWYLVDYENVGEKALQKSRMLKAHNHVIIFFTTNARSIDMRIIADHGAASLELIEVPSGKQSTDVHIDTFVGYLVGHYQETCSIKIVSQDTGYDKVINFWKDREKVDIERVTKVDTTAEEVPSQQENTLSIDVKNILIANGIKTNIANEIVSIVGLYAKRKYRKHQIHNDIVNKYGQVKGLHYYKLFKNIL